MTVENPVFEYDAAVVGVEVNLGTVAISPERVAAYLKGTGETDPRYTDAAAANAGPHAGLTVPHGILVGLRIANGGGGTGGLDPKVRFGNSHFHSGMRLEAHAAIKPGDTLTAISDVKEVFARTTSSGATMVFSVHRTRFLNQAGVLVGVTESSVVHRQVAARS